MDIDWDDIHLRAEPIGDAAGLARRPSRRTAARSPSAPPASDDLWVASTNGGQLTRLTTAALRPQQIAGRSRKRSFGGLRRHDLLPRRQRQRSALVRLQRRGEPDDSTGHAAVQGQDDQSAPSEEFAEMFDQSWRYLAEHFYDAKFHGPTGTPSAPSIGRWSSTSP